MRKSRIATDLGGRARRFAARLLGEKGVLGTIKEEHAQIAALIEFVEQSSDPDRRRILFDEIAAQLIAHSMAEERELFPRLELHRETRGQVRYGRHMLSEVMHVLQRIEALDPSDPEWSDAFRHLAEQVWSHIDTEEALMLEKAKKLVPPEQLEEMDERYRQAKATARTITHRRRRRDFL